MSVPYKNWSFALQINWTGFHMNVPFRLNVSKNANLKKNDNNNRLKT